MLCVVYRLGISKGFCRRVAKVVFMGTSLAGKSSIRLRYQADEWNSALEPTLDIASIEKPSTGRRGDLLLQVWDTPDQDASNAYSRLCLPDADCCVVVYDVTNRQSCEAIHSVVQQYESACRRPNGVAVVAGNKIDLLSADAPHRDVEKLSASEASTGRRWSRTSAKAGSGIAYLFTAVSEAILEARNKGAVGRKRACSGWERRTS
jgi:small GTP-binding protein